MFKKLVSNLPFSPSLVTQLGFYARRLKKEQWMRRLGVIFMIFALLIQSFAIFSPPESANAANANDMAPGIYSTAKALQYWDNNTYNFRDVLTHFGITRGELASCWYDGGYNMRYSDWPHSFGRVQQGFASERTWDNIPKTGGGTLTLYSKHLGEWNRVNNKENYFVGLRGCNSAKAGPFGIMADCGNLLMQWEPKRNVCPYDNSLPVDDPKCVPPPPPSAECQSLTVHPPSAMLGQTFNLVANATTKNNATISKYVFTINNGSTTLSQTNTTNALTSQWSVKPLASGRYDASVIVNTSAGNKTCQASFDVIAPDPKYDLEKVGNKQSAQPGEIVEYTLTFRNIGNQALTNVVIKDALPAGVTLQGQVTTNPNTGVSGDLFSSDGLKIATVAAGKNVVITYSVKVADKNNLQCGVNKLPNNATATTKELATESRDDNNEWVVDVGRICDCSDPDIAEHDPACHDKKIAINNTRGGVDATTVKASGGDVITYTISVVNTHETDELVSINDALTDTLEYADITDYGGGTFDEATKTLSWQLTLRPGETALRNFAVTIKNPVPSKAHGQSHPLSYDCLMTNSYGTTIDIPVNCPPQKIVEVVVEQLPATGPGENIIFAGIIAAIIVFFYARSRQLGKEVRLVRREFNAGTL
ncbi:DUF11 domain-containing protein [Candidatus Saccharibacteria bacterium]|nr:DUF11 domain-containing protein [Candidatus Saccharibacteria bacterium]